MINYLKKDVEDRTLDILLNILVAVMVLLSFSFIPNIWENGKRPSKLIFEYRNLGRFIIGETIGDMFGIDTNNIEIWKYFENLEQEIKFHDSINVGVIRADGTVENL